MLRPADSVRMARKTMARTRTSTILGRKRSAGDRPWRTLMANKMVGVRILRNLLGPAGNQPTFGLGLEYDRRHSAHRALRNG